MRKIVVFNLLSLDGYFAGPEGDLDWHNVDDEFNKFAIEQTKTFGTIIFGRTTYQLFEGFWPKALRDPTTAPDDRQVAQNIEDVEKIVFSTTLEKVIWNKSKLLKKIDPKEIQQLKEQEGGDMVIFGSGTIVQAMTKLGLIDEYRLMINPVILGKGKQMFTNLKERLTLKLIQTRTFGNGNVLLYYHPRF